MVSAAVLAVQHTSVPQHMLQPDHTHHPSACQAYKWRSDAEVGAPDEERWGQRGAGGCAGH